MTDTQPGKSDLEKRVVSDFLEIIEKASDYEKLKAAVRRYLTFLRGNAVELELEASKPEFGLLSSSAATTAPATSDSQKLEGLSSSDVEKILNSLDDKWAGTNVTIDLSKIKDAEAEALIQRKMSEIITKKKRIQVIGEFISTEETFRDSLQFFIDRHMEFIGNSNLKLKKPDIEALESFVKAAKGIISIQSQILDKNFDLHKSENIKKLPGYFKIMTAFFTRIAEDLSMGRYANLRFNLEVGPKSTKTSGDYFIMPAQRMPRWGLLVKELLKLGDEELNSTDRAEFEKLQKAIEEMGQNMNQIVGSVGDFDSFFKVKNKRLYVEERIKSDDFGKIKGFLDPAFVKSTSKSDDKINLSASPTDNDETSRKTVQQLSDYISCGFYVKVKGNPSSADNKPGHNVTSNYEGQPIVIDLLPKLNNTDNKEVIVLLINKIAAVVDNLKKENPDIKFKFMLTQAFHVALIRHFRDSKKESIKFLLHLEFIIPESDLKASSAGFRATTQFSPISEAEVKAQQAEQPAVTATQTVSPLPVSEPEWEPEKLEITGTPPPQSNKRDVDAPPVPAEHGVPVAAGQEAVEQLTPPPIPIVPPPNLSRRESETKERASLGERQTSEATLQNLEQMREPRPGGQRRHSSSVVSTNPPPLLLSRSLSNIHPIQSPTKSLADWKQDLIAYKEGIQKNKDTFLTKLGLSKYKSRNRQADMLIEALEKIIINKPQNSKELAPALKTVKTEIESMRVTSKTSKLQGIVNGMIEGLGLTKDVEQAAVISRKKKKNG